jgi:hypothetical protein
MTFFSLLQKVNIQEKIKHAPDAGYQTGIIIGSFVPFVVLVGIAYWMYHRAKNRKDLD